MAEPKQAQELYPYQQKIFKRYHDNQGTIQHQRLAELVGELYLAEGKKKERAWIAAGEAMQKLQVPQGDSRRRLMKFQELIGIANVLQELALARAALAAR